MCGIVGYIGNEEAVPVLINGLKKLEYRGYDSAGIAVLGKQGLLVRKSKGMLKFLEEKIGEETASGALAGSVGIGHTRWATHGEPSDINSHPHTDVSGKIAVVHNGIIENHAKLKGWLEDHGVEFRSETDTEVIAHLIDFHYNGNLLQAVLEALKRFEGSYALGIICESDPDRIIAVRKESPLVIGVGKGETLIASDVPYDLSCPPDYSGLARVYCVPKNIMLQGASNGGLARLSELQPALGFCSNASVRHRSPTALFWPRSLDTELQLRQSTCLRLSRNVNFLFSDFSVRFALVRNELCVL
jgi:asparagine synthetase B (glutamine-hydrolysing)